MTADMKAARMREYGEALILENIPIPDIQPDEILVNVKACGMCRSDVQLIDGYFRKYADIPTPITLGHEITGVVSKVAIAKLAILTFARMCVGPDSDRWEGLRSSSPPRRAM
jgi:D-arabinose 1-dehydrogenase-like Zn-dependent alcohol dehydrogenase